MGVTLLTSCNSFSYTFLLISFSSISDILKMASTSTQSAALNEHMDPVKACIEKRCSE